MFKLMQLLLLLGIASCSFKSKDDGTNAKKRQGLTAGELEKRDTDGDLRSDKWELDQGLDPSIANIPELKINFLQNYKITGIFADEKDPFEVDTKIIRDNPNFKFRVGNIVLRQTALKSAAMLGRFSGVSWGKIQQQDYSWVKYPDIAQEFYHSKLQEFKLSSKERELKEVTIELENTIKLQNNGHFPEVKDLELNFYYYDYQKEEYALLHTQKIEKTFQAGVTEDVVVEVRNAPHALLSENYLRRGEFIISEIKDYFIPELGVKYSQLMASVKSKSIPVYEVTPFENKLHYVGLNGKKASFVEIMKRLYDKNFEIKNNQLQKLKQFGNNLGSFNHLNELIEKDKTGKWFVITNKLKKHYLEHEFTPADSVTVSYITGEELARQAQEKIFSYSKELYTGEREKLLPLGNIEKNSKIELNLYPVERKGLELQTENKNFYFRPPQCRNCTGNDWSVSVNFQLRKFMPFTEKLDFKTGNLEMENVDVLINGNVLDLGELYKEGYAKYEINKDSNGLYLHVAIERIHELNVLNPGSENIAYLKMRASQMERASEGVHIQSVKAHKTDPNVHAFRVATIESYQRKMPISIESWGYKTWERHVPWSEHKKGEVKRAFSGFSMDVVSTITNFIN